ncbi:MAG: fibronectin type III domain-containing protein [Acidobacteria bacterium]|nr:fibronectin type III domain-containing protein [Acidobacteriota bacterium]
MGLVIVLASVGIPLAAEPAAASGPPLVSALRVLPSSSATIKLTVSLFTSDEVTTVVVNFGTTAAYGATSRPVRVAASPENSNVTIVLSSLTPGTAYDLRVVVRNASGAVTRTFPPIIAGGVLCGGPGAPVGPAFPTIPISGSGPRTLTDVACAGATCYAVGWAGLPGSAKPGHSIIERFTGSAWVPAPAPAVSQGFLQSVSRASPRFCVAVGEFIHHQQFPLIEESTGVLGERSGPLSHLLEATPLH